MTHNLTREEAIDLAATALGATCGDDGRYTWTDEAGRTYRASAMTLTLLARRMQAAQAFREGARDLSTCSALGLSPFEARRGAAPMAPYEIWLRDCAANIEPA